MGRENFFDGFNSAIGLRSDSIPRSRPIKCEFPIPFPLPFSEPQFNKDMLKHARVGFLRLQKLTINSHTHKTSMRVIPLHCKVTLCAAPVVKRMKRKKKTVFTEQDKFCLAFPSSVLFWGTVLFIFRTADKFHAQLELRKGLASAPFPFSPSLSFISNDGGKEGDKTESVLVVKSNDPTDVFMINKVDQVF